MNVVLIAIGCILMALGLMMFANRSGYVYFVVGPRSVLILAGVVAVLAFWILGRFPDKAHFCAIRCARNALSASGPVKPPTLMLYIGGPTERARLDGDLKWRPDCYGDR